VFGTRAFTAAEVRAEYGPELAAIAAAFSTGRLDDELAGQYRRVVEGLRARGDFVYLDLAYVRYFDHEQPTGYLTIDVVERADSAVRMAFRPVPTDTVPDPDGTLAAFSAYLERGMALLMAGALAGPEPPCPVLHCPPGFHHETLRAEGERFLRAAPRHREAIARALHRDADAQRRAAAAFLLGLTDDADAAAALLADALADPAPAVRNNALRVLIMAAQREPPVAIPLGPVIRALHYPATTDRNKAAYVLLGLASRPEHRAEILRDAGPVLLDMLALEQPNNRDPAWEVLRLLSGEDRPAEDVVGWRAWWQHAMETQP
jgi:hypothetical protein